MRWWLLAIVAIGMILLILPWRERRPARVEPELAVPTGGDEEGEGEREAEGLDDDDGEDDGEQAPEPAELVDEGREATAQAEGVGVVGAPNGPGAVEAQPDVPPPEAAGPIDELRSSFEQDGAASDAAQVELAIRDLFGTAELPLDVLRRVECRKKVCRAEIWWSEKRPYVYMAFAMTAGTQQGSQVAVLPGEDRNVDGELPLTVYLLRAGHTLEDLSAAAEAPEAEEAEAEGSSEDSAGDEPSVEENDEAEAETAE